MRRKLLFNVNIFNKKINLCLIRSMLHRMYLDLKYWYFKYIFISFESYTSLLCRQRVERMDDLQFKNISERKHSLGVYLEGRRKTTKTSGQPVSQRRFWRGAFWLRVTPTLIWICFRTAVSHFPSSVTTSPFPFLALQEWPWWYRENSTFSILSLF